MQNFHDFYSKKTKFNQKLDKNDIFCENLASCAKFSCFLYMIERKRFLQQISDAFKIHPIVALLGPRQCGKTTLARAYMKLFPDFPSRNYFDCENNIQLMRLENPLLALGDLTDLIIIDEIQLMPDLFKTLRVLVDRENNQQRYLILGSASRDLIKQSSETLAGRIQYIELTPLSLSDHIDINQYWLRGGFPNAYLAESIDASFMWRKAYIKTYLERDIPNLGFNIPANTLQRFWMMLAHYHGSIFNASEIGQALGIASTTARRYLEILTGTFMMRELQPWLENIKKRRVKSPKIYFRDSGIYHTLVNVFDENSLATFPKLGISWEGMALEEIIRCHSSSTDAFYFWGIHNQSEIDLLIFDKGKRLGFEFKYSDKPKVTRSMQNAIELLNLDMLTVISPGDHDFPLTEKINAVGLTCYINTFFQ